MPNSGLIAAQSLFGLDMHDVIEVTSWNGRDNYGKAVLDSTTTRRYNCLIQANENSKWGTQNVTDAFPYIAYVLTVPIGQEDLLPIRVEEQITIITPTYWDNKKIRRLGNIQSFPDQYGNLFVQQFTFE